MCQYKVEIAHPSQVLQRVTVLSCTWLSPFICIATVILISELKLGQTSIIKLLLVDYDRRRHCTG